MPTSSTAAAGSTASAGAAPVLHLRSGGVSVLVDQSGPGLPQVLHWGRDLGEIGSEELRSWVGDLPPGVPSNAVDDPWPFTLSPSQADAWLGEPGLAGHREGTQVFSRFRLSAPGAVGTLRRDVDGAQSAHWHAVDREGELGLNIDLRLEASGLLRLRHSVVNEGDTPYQLDSLAVLLALPGEAQELADTSGRHNHEHTPQRAPFGFGTHRRVNRRGRTGHDAPLLLAAGTPGFSFRSGEVWGVHVGFSGNHVHLAERLPEGAGSSGQCVIGGGEYLLPGEIALGPGESYASPWVYFGYSGVGLDGISRQFYDYLRARPGHPRTPRPLTINIWEAVYFDHDLTTLTALAERAAGVGVERFVVDDGWFGSRRDDSSGLGDWQIAAEVWPDGLRPLADRVRALGMQFGLWFEPEMANPDSELARQHPEWLLVRPAVGSAAGDAARWPRLSRRQVLVDTAHPDAYAYLLESISELVTSVGVDYIKWDHNRDLHEAVRDRDGLRGAVHAQTLATYRLLDDLRSRHPGLEIESCASGGGRVDLGILEHTDRIWGSDTNDPLERTTIQRYTGLVVPPELVGSHVGPPVSHTTGRHADLSMRTITALFAHAGIEWNILECSPAELAALTRWTATYRELRVLLHSGDVVRVDDAPPGMVVHGVVARDRSEAVFALVRTATAVHALPGRVRLAGLDPDTLYRVSLRSELHEPQALAAVPPAWFARGELVARGSILAGMGFTAPQLQPEQAIVVHLTRV